jgi:hypothetical protein
MSAGYWKRIAVIMALASFCTIGSGQRATSDNQRFTAPDGTFIFYYPTDFQLCTQGKMEPCRQSFIPPCDEDALVCAVYPAKEFKDTNFEAAGFQVREIIERRERMTADVCVTPYPQKGVDGIPTEWAEFLVSAEHPAEVVGGVEFVHGVKGGVATGSSISTDLYRALHKERCFELSVSEAEASPYNYDPPIKTLTPAQQKRLNDTMSHILHSFRFLN